MVKSHSRLKALPLAAVLLATAAFGLEVRIEPGSYAGHYQAAGHSATSGESTIDVNPGTYAFANGSSSFHFTVDAGGAVTSLDTDAALGAGNTLVLHNTTVTIEPGGYGGRYSMYPSGYYGGFYGEQSFVLVPGMTWWFNNGGDQFRFSVDANGTVTSLDPAAAQGVGSSLVLNNAAVTIDPVGYGGQYSMYPSGYFGRSIGEQTFVLIPGMSWWFNNGGDQFRFAVAASGTVASLDPAAAQGLGNRLVLNNATVTIDPVAYVGMYSMYPSGYYSNFSGERDLVLIPGMEWWFHNGADQFRFAVAGDGTVTSRNADAAHGDGSALVLENVRVAVDPTTYGGHYAIYRQPASFSGPSQATLIPGLKARVSGSGGPFVEITPWPGFVDPSSAPVTIGGVAYTFRFSTVTNQPPMAFAGIDIHAEATSPRGAAVVLDGSGSSDPDGDSLTFLWSATGITISDSTNQRSSAVFPLGPTAVSLTVVDPSGESSTDEVIVIVSDTTPPTLTVVAGPESLWPPNHKLIGISLSVQASDLYDESPSVTASVMSNEPDDANGGGDGKTTGDIRITASSGEVLESSGPAPQLDFDPLTSTLSLRAERQARGSGRVYTLTLTATDARGNHATQELHFQVAHDAGGGTPKVIPEAYSLAMLSYPNPFNPVVTIEYSLPEAGRAALEVYDLLGRRIRTLVDAHGAAGTHLVAWDGRDQSGQQVASGVYFSRLRAGGSVVSGKLIYAR